jgi:hypothetical protein
MSRKHHRSHQITSDFYQRKIKDLKNSYDNWIIQNRFYESSLKPTNRSIQVAASKF